MLTCESGRCKRGVAEPEGGIISCGSSAGLTTGVAWRRAGNGGGNVGVALVDGPPVAGEGSIADTTDTDVTTSGACGGSGRGLADLAGRRRGNGGGTRGVSPVPGSMMRCDALQADGLGVELLYSFQAGLSQELCFQRAVSKPRP